MALKKILNIMKTDSESIVARIDKFLTTASDESSEDRGHGMNSPSSIGYCIRAQFYNRTGVKSISVTPPRSQRIFDNGHYVHDRLQTYLEKMGILKLREVPLYHKELEIMGHSDGLVQMSPMQLSVLEIKSINDNGFSKLVEAHEEHVKQANVYMLCVEELRKIVHSSKYNRTKLIKEYRTLLEGFVTDGSRYTREEKIEYHVQYFTQLLDLLKEIVKPINTVIILYENKNNQDLKSFTIKWDDDLMEEITSHYKKLNKLVAENECPNRPEDANGRTCSLCRGCNHVDKCY